METATLLEGEDLESIKERRAIQHEAQMAQAKRAAYLETCQRVGLTPMSKVVAEKVSFLWNPYIPLGKVTLLDGDPGLGKSYITLAVATAVSRGYGLPGETRRDPGRVLLMNAEDGLGDTIRPRLDQMMADCENILAISKRLILDPGGLDDLQKILEESLPRLVVIDPLFAYTGSKMDIHRANETRELMDKVSRLASAYQCAILGVRHLTKGGRDKSIYRGVGSIDILAACRSVLLAGADAEDRNKRALLQIKNNLAPLGEGIGYEIREGVFSWTGKSDLTADRILASEQSVKNSLRIEDAAEFLREELSTGPMSSKDIMSRALKAGLSERTVWRAKKEVGVQAHKIGGERWAWELPARAP
jgi:RecA-family ATPase